MKAIKELSDKASDYLDKKGLANPAEVLNESLGGETREESKKRREASKEKPEPKMETKKMAKGGVTRADGCCIRGKTKGRMV